jgi:sulfur relay (sulfurtransferase) DsrC/TusE family protein
VPDFSDERLLLHEVKNHAEFKQKLTRLKLSSDLATLDASVVEVTVRWLQLARLHAEELNKLNPAEFPRAVYSRAYYTAYNASKAVRYQSKGIVSLAGDDHRRVADLPNSFPNVDAWTTKLQLIYEHRLRADYDNWSNTTGAPTQFLDTYLSKTTRRV